MRRANARRSATSDWANVRGPWRTLTPTSSESSRSSASAPSASMRARPNCRPKSTRPSGAPTSTRTCARSSTSVHARRRRGNPFSMTDHQQRADRLEREADELDEQPERLGEEIADTREQWERMRRDESVPGAADPESGLPPEANYTTSGDKPPQDDPEREPWPDE